MSHITLRSRTISAYGEYNTLQNYQQKTVRTEYFSNIYLWLLVSNWLTGASVMDIKLNAS